MANTGLDVFTRAAQASRTEHDRKMGVSNTHGRNDSVTMTISMTEVDRQMIRDAAKKMSLSVSALVRVAVREYVRTHGDA